MNQIWKTEQVIHETVDTLTIIFNPGKETFAYKAGQFINVHIAINGITQSRSYSLSSSPGEALPAITVKKIEGGLVSNYIHEYAETIKEWRVEGPQGLFCIDHSLQTIPQYVFIAGGSGITPIYSMLNDVLRNTNAEIFLIYSSKNFESKIFYSDLQELQSKYSNRLAIQYMLSSDHPQDNPSASPLLGRLNRLVLKKILKGQLQEKIASAHFFVCGPAGLISVTEETIASLQIDSDKIHREYFQPPDVTAPSVEIPESSLEVLLHVQEQTNLIIVNPGTSILESALEDKIEVPYSCKSGTCGRCAAKLLSGKVHMYHNYALTNDQLSQGYVLLCQSTPLDDTVEIEVL